jgi:hypothetical protein
VVLQAPNSLPLDVLPADGCVAMAASVPAAADIGDVGIAKQTVLATAQHLQVGPTVLPLPGMQCMPLSMLCRIGLWCGMNVAVARHTAGTATGKGACI